MRRRFFDISLIILSVPAVARRDPFRVDAGAASMKRPTSEGLGGRRPLDPSLFHICKSATGTPPFSSPSLFPFPCSRLPFPRPILLFAHRYLLPSQCEGGGFERWPYSNNHAKNCHSGCIRRKTAISTRPWPRQREIVHLWEKSDRGVAVATALWTRWDRRQRGMLSAGLG